MGRRLVALSLVGLLAGRLRKDSKLASWFLLSFYRHARGFLGWDARLVEKALAYVPGQAADMGALPAAGKWVKLELPLAKIGTADALLDGVGFLHEGGRVWRGRTSLVGPDGDEVVVWGGAVELPSAALARTTIHVGGPKAGARVRVLFEGRELTAADGHFRDDFRGQDLYERYGGPGYGPEPVALHVYEIGTRQAAAGKKKRRACALRGSLTLRNGRDRRRPVGSQGRPLLVETFLLDLPDLTFAHAEAFGDEFAGLWHAHFLVLGVDQRLEDLFPTRLWGMLFHFTLRHGCSLVHDSDTPEIGASIRGPSSIVLQVG
jgi:hypothetical protein